MHLVNGLNSLFGEEYLRDPTDEDHKYVLAWNERGGSPDILGSIDC